LRVEDYGEARARRARAVQVGIACLDVVGVRTRAVDRRVGEAVIRQEGRDVAGRDRGPAEEVIAVRVGQRQRGTRLVVVRRRSAGGELIPGQEVRAGPTIHLVDTAAADQ